jgi:hypothetical protein
MDTLRTLLWADRIAATRWFTSRSASRIIVALLFFLVFGAVATGIYAMSNAFFSSLTIYGQFGQMTADYIIHASIIIVLWLALGSSVASVAGLLLSTTPSLSYILALPVSGRALNIWLFSKAVAATFLLMIFAFVPIAAAYANAFGVLSVLFLIRILLMLLCIVLISSSVGMLVGLVSVGWFRGREYPAAVVGMTVFFAAMAGILRLIFPPALSKLYDAPASMFLPIYTGLPLNNPSLPTSWMAGTITTGFSSETLIVLGLTALVVGACLAFVQTRLVGALLRVRSAGYTGRVSDEGFKAFGKSRAPLVLKDWYSIFRLPAERGYGLFLGSVAVFFFLMLSFGVGHELHRGPWDTQLIVFSFAWIAFFATAYFLRFLFPLVAREGKSAWYIFTIPIPRSRLLLAKILFSMLFSVPVMVFAGVVWYLLPFAGVLRTQLIYISIVFVLILALSHVLLGAIIPNFSQGNDPEKVSTSGMGLLTLLVSGLLVAITAQIINYMMHVPATATFVITILPDAGAIFLLLLWVIFRDFMKPWEW